jgi:hypothetical protein
LLPILQSKTDVQMRLTAPDRHLEAWTLARSKRPYRMQIGATKLRGINMIYKAAGSKPGVVGMVKSPERSLVQFSG